MYKLQTNNTTTVHFSHSIQNTDLTDTALGHRAPSLAKCFRGEFIHRPTGKWSFPKRGLPDSSILMVQRRETQAKYKMIGEIKGLSNIDSAYKDDEKIILKEQQRDTTIKEFIELIT